MTRPQPFRRPTPAVPAALRVLVICGGSYVSGAELIALSVMRGLRERGHNLFCIASAWSDGDFPGRLRELGLMHELLYLGKVSAALRWPYPWWTLNALRHLPRARSKCRRLLREFDPDVVLVYNRDIFILLSSVLPRSKTVYHVQEIPVGSRRARHLLLLIDRAVSRHVCVSRFVAGRLGQLGIAEDKLVVVHNGVEDGAPDAHLSGAKRSARETAIGIVGQIGEWKGHGDLADALATLKNEGCGFRWYIFGRGSRRFTDALHRDIERQGLGDRVTWAGFVRDASSIYTMLDVCVVPSRFEEPFGLVAAEAGLWGLPVVATRRGGLPEIVVDGRTGFLVESHQPAELADRIRRLVHDPELRLRMGEAARDHVRRSFPRERMVSEMERICRDIAAHGAQRV